MKRNRFTVESRIAPSGKRPAPFYSRLSSNVVIFDLGAFYQVHVSNEVKLGKKFLHRSLFVPAGQGFIHSPSPRLRDGMQFRRFRSPEFLVPNYMEKSDERHVPKTDFRGPHEEDLPSGINEASFLLSRRSLLRLEPARVRS